MTASLKWVTAYGYDTYGPYIEQLVGREFPQLASGKIEDRMEAIVAEFFATKQYRIGPKPNPESEVRIRDVVRRAIEINRSIPILIALAAIKVPIGESIDVAELGMLRTLCALNQRVKQHYAPGISVRLRLEDLTEFAISGASGDNVANIEQHVATYIASLKSLIQALGYEGFITVVPESSLVDPALFAGTVNTLTPVFMQYLALGDAAMRAALNYHGWKGGVSPAMQEYLYARYDRLYPDTVHGDAAQQYHAARYLAAILTRRNMDAMGDDKNFDGRLEIGFAPALPDAPLVSTRVYYRTIPREQSSLHLPPWLAKGYVQFDEDGLSHFALGRWDEEYTMGQLEIVGESGARAVIRADYRVQDSY